MFSFRCLLISSLGLTALALAYPAAAQTTVIGLAPTGGTAESNAATAGVSSYSLGFAFTTASSAVTVTSLGYFYDPNFDPSTPTFASPHEVGLYTAGGTLLTSASVTSAGTQAGNFLFTSITPFVLTPSTQYVIAGVTGATDPYLYTYNDGSGASGITINPAITFNENRYTVSDTLAYASSTDAGLASGFLGPNFQISPAASAAPEPSQWGMLGLTVLGLSAGLYHARRRRSGVAAD